MAFLQIKDYRLTTAEILYHYPDHPALLQSYVWQNMDIAPDYPELRRFLSFWRNNLDGKLHSIRVACAEIMRTGAMRHSDHLKYLN